MTSPGPAPRTIASGVRALLPELAPVAPGAAGTRVDRSAAFAIKVLGAYLIFKMFYVFNTGTAQPADITLAMMALVITSPSLFLQFVTEQKTALFFVIWVTLVQMMWAALTFKWQFTLFMTFYIFNMMILVLTYSLRCRAPAEFDRIIMLGLKLSIVVQFGVVVAEGVGSRAAGSFLNPNQLAYWGVLALSMMLVIRRSATKLSDLPFIALGCFTVIASLSRAGVIAVVLLLAIWAWYGLRTPFRRLAVAVISFALISLALAGGMGGRLTDSDGVGGRFEQRVATRSVDNPLEGRNYDRITNFPQYTILGAGEGYYSRFQPSWSPKLAIEIHSSFATMLFSYGVVGLLLFMGTFYSAIRAVPLSVGAYILPALTYGITHQGLRFSFLWILVGILCSMTHEGLASKQAARPNSPRGPRAFAPRGPEALRSLRR